MRNTARPQVIALALLGALAWMAMDLVDLRAAMADWIHPPAIEAADPLAIDELPAPRPTLEIEVLPVKGLPPVGEPVPAVWHLGQSPELVVG